MDPGSPRCALRPGKHGEGVGEAQRRMPAYTAAAPKRPATATPLRPMTRSTLQRPLLLVLLVVASAAAGALYSRVRTPPAADRGAPVAPGCPIRPDERCGGR